MLESLVASATLKLLPKTVDPVISEVPITCNFELGLVIPIPTLPPNACSARGFAVVLFVAPSFT